MPTLAAATAVSGCYQGKETLLPSNNGLARFPMFACIHLWSSVTFEAFGLQSDEALIRKQHRFLCSCHSCSSIPSKRSRGSGWWRPDERTVRGTKSLHEEHKSRTSSAEKQEEDFWCRQATSSFHHSSDKTTLSSANVSLNDTLMSTALSVNKVIGIQKYRLEKRLRPVGQLVRRGREPPPNSSKHASVKTV